MAIFLQIPTLKVFLVFISRIMQVQQCVRDYEYQVPFGVVKSDGHKVLDIEEKPVQRFSLTQDLRNWARIRSTS